MRGVIGQRRRNGMFKILIIEGILSLLIGAVVFRLAWAFGKSNGVSWGLTAFLAVIVLIFSPGQIDSGLIGEYGGGRALSFLSPFLLRALRALCVLVGAWLASRVVAKRRKMGLENDEEYRDFP